MRCNSWSYGLQQGLRLHFPNFRQLSATEDLIRIDYNVTSKARLYGHYLDNNNTYTSYYGTWIAGSNIPVTPITVTNPGYAWGVGAPTSSDPR
ncbi:MAG: hypothetical protein WDO73_28470 [Ignavibacteriota bacterium]